MKLALIIFVVLFACMSAVAAEDLQQQCGSHPDLLRDSSGALKWLTAEEAKARVATSVTPDPVDLPGGALYTGVVGAKIMVNTSGEVVCLWGASGNPMLLAAAIRALHQWRFRPMVVGGKPVEFLAQVKVPVRSATAQK